MPDYRRYRVPGGTYFFKVNLLERRQDILVRYIGILGESVHKKQKKRLFHSNAWMVLPGHIRYVWAL